MKLQTIEQSIRKLNKVRSEIDNTVSEMQNIRNTPKYIALDQHKDLLLIKLHNSTESSLRLLDAYFDKCEKEMIQPHKDYERLMTILPKLLITFH
jgi:hypothetical protein